MLATLNTTRQRIIVFLVAVLLLCGLSVVAQPAPAQAFSGFAYTVTCPAGTRYQYVKVTNPSGSPVYIRTSNGSSTAPYSPRWIPHYHYTWARTTTYYFSGPGNLNWYYAFYCQA